MNDGRMNRKSPEVREMAKKLGVFDDMINALVKLLEEKANRLQRG